MPTRLFNGEFNQPLTKYAVRHAPHNMSIGGKQFKGGQFIPAGDYAKATPEQKKAIADGKSSGPVSRHRKFLAKHIKGERARGSSNVRNKKLARFNVPEHAMGGTGASAKAGGGSGGGPSQLQKLQQMHKAANRKGKGGMGVQDAVKAFPETPVAGSGGGKTIPASEFFTNSYKKPPLSKSGQRAKDLRTASTESLRGSGTQRSLDELARRGQMGAGAQQQGQQAEPSNHEKLGDFVAKLHAAGVSPEHLRIAVEAFQKTLQ